MRDISESELFDVNGGVDIWGSLSALGTALWAVGGKVTGAFGAGITVISSAFSSSQQAQEIALLKQMNSNLYTIAAQGSSDCGIWRDHGPR